MTQVKRSLLFGVFSFALPALIYLVHIRYLGFPDGYMTGFERMVKALFPAFLLLNLASGIVFTWSAFALLKGKESIKGPLTMFIYGYVAAISACIIAYFILGTYLDHGGGG